MFSKVSLIAGCLVLVVTFCDKASANDLKCKVPKMYEEIGCTEVKDSSGAVTSFNCPDFKTYDSNKCYLNGKTFNVGDDIGDNEVDCRASCKCIKHDEDKEAKVICANVECPEHFNVRRNPDCVNQYKDAKQCCRSGESCGQARTSLGQCEFEGKTYRVGEKMYPEGGSCHNCLCTENFNNLTAVEQNPDCRKINCGIGLKLNSIRKGCIPVYYNTPTCCPIEYKCPSEDDAIESSPTADGKSTCTFGDLTFKRGDKLKTGDKCMNCECSIPPYLTCVKTNC